MAASSKRPVKRYNLLVPDIFPAKPQAFTDKIDPSTERKIKKLYEYLDKNLHRCPKVMPQSHQQNSSQLLNQVNDRTSKPQLADLLK